MSYNDSERAITTINTSVGFQENLSVDEHARVFREQLSDRFRSTFDELPDIANSGSSLDQYLDSNSKCITFVPQKDINMYSVVLNEADKFMDNYREPKEKLYEISKIRSHEFEHVQKMYELGKELQGMGTVMYKKNGKPVFTYFAVVEDYDSLSLRENLQIRLAPRTYAFWNNDVLSSGAIVFDKIKKTKSWKAASNIAQDVMFVLSERLLPRGIHDSLENNAVFRTQK